MTGLRVDDGGYVARVSDGSEIEARSVVLAMGVTYRRLGIPSSRTSSGKASSTGRRRPTRVSSRAETFVVGGANSAGQAAVHLSRYARSVTLLCRGDSLSASMSQYLIEEIEAQENVEIRPDLRRRRGAKGGWST